MIKSNCVFDESNCVFDESNLFQKNEKNSIVISFFVGEIKQCWDCCVSRISLFFSFFFFWYFWEWLVHERLRLKFFFFFLAYKSSLKDSIFKWTPCGKYAKSDVIRTLKSSL